MTDIRAWAVVDKDGAITLVRFSPTLPEIWDKACASGAPHTVVEVAIIPAARFDALEAENKALRTVTPEMIAAGWEVARKGRPGGKVFIGPGPAFKEIYEAMSARALEAKK